MSFNSRKITGFNDSYGFDVIGDEIYINDPGESYKSKLINGIALDLILSYELENVQSDLHDTVEDNSHPIENAEELYIHEKNQLNLNDLIDSIDDVKYLEIHKSYTKKSKTQFIKNTQFNGKDQKKIKTHNLKEKMMKDKRNKFDMLKHGNFYKIIVRKDNDGELRTCHHNFICSCNYYEAYHEYYEYYEDTESDYDDDNSWIYSTNLEPDF